MTTGKDVQNLVKIGKEKIVVIDDDEAVLSLLSSAFTSKGFNVKCINNGKEALKYLLDEQNVSTTSLIILDRLLADMDGVQILRKFTEKFPEHVPVLVVSILSPDVLIELKPGKVEYVKKPFSLAILMEKAIGLIKH